MNKRRTIPQLMKLSKQVLKGEMKLKE